LGNFPNMKIFGDKNKRQFYGAGIKIIFEERKKYA
jgi:hypothetical protein